MIVARKLRQDNIVDYLLYMWQVEDLIRACNLDKELVEERLVARYSELHTTVREELRQWYYNLTDMMRTEGLQERGHISGNAALLKELEQLHHRLSSDEQDVIYAGIYYRSLPAIIALRAKNPAPDARSEIEIALTAVYGYTMLRLRGETVLEDTLAALRHLSALLALLSERYKEVEMHQNAKRKNI